MQVIKPNSPNQSPQHLMTLFLAGSIENGTATNWQQMVENRLLDSNITIFNPRRDYWDSTWIQRKSNHEFNYQVNWELNRLEEASAIIMYFDPETKSPITLLELGIHVNNNKRLFVCCPDKFYRKGNVEIVCERFKIPLFTDIESTLSAIDKKYRIFK
jgi:hypothetical protein